MKRNNYCGCNLVKANMQALWGNVFFNQHFNGKKYKKTWRNESDFNNNKYIRYNHFFSLYHHTVLCNMYRKLDGLLWTDAHQLGPKASIQPQHPFVTNDLLEAVPAVLVHQLSHHGTRSLVLHPGFHQVYWVNCSCTSCWN